jgi:YfiH family protein
MQPSDFELNQTEGIKWLSFPPLNALPFVLHGFMVKGQSATAESGSKVLRRLLKTISPHKATPVSLSQMHRDECVILSSRDQLKKGYFGDAVLTDRHDVLISVAVADCLPIFMANPKRMIIGMIHAGWRGALLGVASRTLEEARRRFGCEPDEFTVLLGPCIRSCCYRVSDDVAILFDPDCVNRSPDGEAMLDLVQVNLKQLAQGGVKEDRIFATAVCTFCDEELFCSYRREKEDCGRMIGFLSLR